ncbi:MAG TPA: hypothetical protein VFP10_01735, partial [Candidatus Eisenbacteria bacterium]|nr:hypothetical protein [Candidatus Eisenbacteria bacterium]
PAVAQIDTLRVPCQLSTYEARIGERIQVRLAMPKPDPTSRLIGPPPRDYGPFQVFASEPGQAAGESTAWTLDMAVFDVGDRSLRELPFVLQDHEKARPVIAEDCRVHIEASLPDTATRAGLREVKAPIEVPLRWRWGRIALALGLLAALVALLVWWRRRPAPEIAAIEAPPVSPEEEALGALRELEDAALPARGRMSEHYFRLSVILRRYVERRFPIPAVESTTAELRFAFTRVSGLPRDTDALLDLLEESDLVKFARYDPGINASRTAVSTGRAWIERNRPAELPEPAETVHAAR